MGGRGTGREDGTGRRLYHGDVDRSLSLLFVSSLLIEFRERATTNIGRCGRTDETANQRIGSLRRAAPPARPGDFTFLFHVERRLSPLPIFLTIR